MSNRLALTPRAVSILIVLTFCMKLFETQSEGLLSHPLRMFYILAAITSALAIVFFIKSSRRVIDNSEYRLPLCISGLLIAYFVLFGVFLQNPSYQKETNSTLVYTLSYVLFIIVCSIFVSKYKLLDVLVQYLYICTVGFLFYICLTNFDGFQVINHLSGMLVSYDRYNVTYGLYHKNALGNISLAAIILSLVHYNLNLHNGKFLRKAIHFLLYLPLILILLSSGSRSSITGFILFFCLYVGGTCYQMSNSYRIKVIVVFFLAIIVFFLAAYSGINIFEVFYNASNRGKNFDVNLPALFNNSRALIGIGLVNPGLFGTGGLLVKTYYLDNYYLYVLMSTGVLGTVWIVVTFLLLFLFLLKTKEKRLKVLLVSIFLTDLYVGLFETCIINALFPSVFIYMLLFLCGPNYQENVELYCN